MNLSDNSRTTQSFDLNALSPCHSDAPGDAPLKDDERVTQMRATWLTREPHLWQRGTVDRAALLLAADQLRANHGFVKAYGQYADQIQKTIVTNWALSRVMHEMGRYGVTAFTLYLHHSQQTGLWGEAGVTYARVIELFAAGALTKEGSLASPSRIKAMLGIAEIAGHLERCVPAPPDTSHNGVFVKNDRRMRLLRPTPELTRPSLLWLHSFLQCIEPVTPLAMSPETMVGLPGFLGEVMSYHVLAYVHDQCTPREDFACVHQFIQRNGAFLTLLEVVRNLRCENGVWISSAPPGELAKRLGISRNTVRNLLVESEQKLWLRIVDRGAHRIELSGAFADECERWLACEMVWMAGLANAAAMRLQGALKP